MLQELITDLGTVSSEIKNKITPANLKQGVSAFGIAGTLVEKKGSTRNVEPRRTMVSIGPDEAKGCNCINYVNVKPVTSSIDSNITPRNIRNSTSILGVEGILSNLSEEDYKEAIELIAIIRGFNNYVLHNKLILNNASVEDKTLILNEGTVDENVLILE